MVHSLLISERPNALEGQVRLQLFRYFIVALLKLAHYLTTIPNTNLKEQSLRLSGQGFGNTTPCDEEPLFCLELAHDALKLP